MKAILKFNLADSHERNAHMRALKADKAYYVLSEMDRHLRDILKHQELNEDQELAYQSIRTYMNDLIRDQGIQMEDEWT